MRQLFLLSVFWLAFSTAFVSHTDRSYRYRHCHVSADGAGRQCPVQTRPFQTSRTAPAQWTSSSLLATKNQKQQTHKLVEVGDCIGSGSYGTVHFLTVRKQDGDDTFQCIGKRAWTLQELEKKQELSQDASYLKDRTKRCAYYWGVERHCFEKLPAHVGLTTYRGVLDGDSAISESQGPWMLFDLAESESNAPAPTLKDVMAKDRLDHKEHHQHHLHFLQQALGVVSDESDVYDNPLAATLDMLLGQLLQVLQHVHDHDIVHRDMKPENLLIADGRVILIDFGSAADVTTAGILKENVGWGERVAISPVYAAPEVFCDVNRSAVNFDTFSAALIACQLLFQYLDERTDAGFHQQLAAANNNLDTWLKTQWQSKVRPAGLAEGLDVLSARPGLWGLLQDMLQTDPVDRLSSTKALKRLEQIRAGTVPGADGDGTYLASILAAQEECPIPVARALEFVASFRRGESLGLVLAEADAADTSDMEGLALSQWKRAVEDAGPGEVFVQEIAEGGQAEDMGIFEIGDQLQGVGELPVSQGGFERVVKMLGERPRLAKYTTLHFDRKSALVGSKQAEALPIPSMEGPIQVSDQGAWSSQGRRKAQEDTFVVVEVHDTKDRSILLAGVMDGHLGKAASSEVQKHLPQKFSEELLRGTGDGDTPIGSILQTAWEQTCDAYRFACSSGDECIAEYDPREGILMANTGSEDYAAGTTTCVVALEKKTSDLAVLNCGDSRGLIIDSDGQLVFKTHDHKPDREIDRFTQGRKQGLGYGEPGCRMSRWYVPVGEYEYAVSRSLEGPFATSCGIVSTADISTLQATAGTTVVVATDGLWEVMDSEQVAGISYKLRFQEGMSAGDAAKTLCSMALERGSSDNVSVVFLYLD